MRSHDLLEIARLAKARGYLPRGEPAGALGTTRPGTTGAGARRQTRQSSLSAWCVSPVPTPVCCPPVWAARVAAPPVATDRGVVGAYIASSNACVVGVFPTANTVAARPPEKDV